MRLSYTQISFLHFFLITFLTLFLKPDAKAQSMLATNVSHHHIEHNQPLVDNDLIQPVPVEEKHDVSLVNEAYLSAVNFPHTSALLLPIKSARSIYAGYHPLRVRIYSTS